METRENDLRTRLIHETNEYVRNICVKSNIPLWKLFRVTKKCGSDDDSPHATPSIHFASVDHVTRARENEVVPRRAISRRDKGSRAFAFRVVYVQRASTPAPLPLCRKETKEWKVDRWWTRSYDYSYETRKYSTRKTRDVIVSEPCRLSRRWNRKVSHENVKSIEKFARMHLYVSLGGEGHRLRLHELISSFQHSLRAKVEHTRRDNRIIKMFRWTPIWNSDLSRDRSAGIWCRRGLHDKVRSRFLWHGYVSKAALRKWDGKKFLTIVTAARYRNESISSRDLCIVFTRSRGLVGWKEEEKKWRGDWIINHMWRSKLLDRERKNISRWH